MTNPAWLSTMTLPPYETPVRCLLRYCTSGNIQEHLLIRVDEPDQTWRTADDRSEVAYDWDVIAWRPNDAPAAGCPHASPRKWEYKLVDSPKNPFHKEVERILNTMGEDGWELAEMDYGAFIFKRLVKPAGGEA